MCEQFCNVVMQWMLELNIVAKSVICPSPSAYLPNTFCLNLWPSSDKLLVPSQDSLQLFAMLCQVPGIFSGPTGSSGTISGLCSIHEILTHPQISFCCVGHGRDTPGLEVPFQLYLEATASPVHRPVNWDAARRRRWCRYHAAQSSCNTSKHLGVNNVEI